MGIVIHLFHFVGGEVGVYLGGAEGLMSEEFLDDAEIGPIVEHMGGKAVPESMGADSGVEAGLEEVFVQFAAHGAGTEPFTMLVDKKGLWIETLFARVAVTEVEILLYGLQGR